MTHHERALRLWRLWAVRLPALRLGDLMGRRSAHKRKGHATEKKVRLKASLSDEAVWLRAVRQPCSCGLVLEDFSCAVCSPGLWRSRHRVSRSEAWDDRRQGMKTIQQTAPLVIDKLQQRGVIALPASTPESAAELPHTGAAAKLPHTVAPIAFSLSTICCGEPVNTTRPFSM